MSIVSNLLLLPVSAALAALPVPAAQALPTYVGTAAVDSAKKADFDRLMNLGKAYLENRDSKKAIEVLSEAVKLEPNSAPAVRNLARAYLLARKPDQTLTTLKQAASLETTSVATSYLMGLTFTRMSHFEEALPHFENAVRLDPHTATLRFQLAGVYQVIGQHDKAVEQLQETVRLDPLHASAHFKLAGYARRAGTMEEFQRRHREFMRLRKLFGDETRSAVALEQCVYTLPEPAPIEATRRGPERAAALEVRFNDVTDQVFVKESDRAATAAAVLDADKIGGYTLFVADEEGGFGLVNMSPAGTFQRTPVNLKLPGKPVFTSCSTGNFHDDVPEGTKYDPKVHALNDVLLNGPSGLRLLKRTGRDSFRDVTEVAGLKGVTANRAQWVDYEHDGDLDLLLARPSGLELWQNNGDGRFENVTAKVGIGKTGAVVDVAAVDLDANIAVDIVAARGTKPTLVFENQRAGRFARMPEPPGPWPTANLMIVEDVNNDGHADTMLIADQEAIVLLGKTAIRQRIDLSKIEVSAATLIDYDNDGWLDFCVLGTRAGAADEGMVRLYRNVGAAGWSDVSEATHLASLQLPSVRSVVPADLDNDGDTGLLLVTSGGRLRFLRNDGGHANGQLKIRLTTLKTNPTGMGTHIELRDGSWWVTRTVTQLPIEIGLEGRERLDAVQTVWTNGVVDNQVNLAVGPKPLTIVEKNVAAGSCPFLYVWDGRGFRFVTDLLGNSPIGLSLSRDAILPADPDEIVLIGDANHFPMREGAYTVIVTDEFREVLYLDHVKLLAVDHPPLYSPPYQGRDEGEVEVHPTDKLMPPPFPPSEVWALGTPKSLIRAEGDDGIDRTEAVRELDSVFAPPGLPLPSPFRGMCHPLALTLDFGPLDSTHPLVLALTGWLQYGDASTNIAMSQSSALTIIPPRLEVEVAPDRLESRSHSSRSHSSQSHSVWQPVDLTVGMPAGKTKTILCDLTGKLPVGARRLRLTTTFEIRWDRIALFERHTLPKRHVHELLPNRAELQWRGFSEIKQRAPGHPTTPNFNLVVDQPAWRTALEGWCTRYGDVLELVRQQDDRLVLLNSGDALTLSFDAAKLPAVPDGLVRTFFFSSVGWDKDGDHNVVTGDVVEPLPSMTSKSRKVEKSKFRRLDVFAFRRFPRPSAERDGAPSTDWRLKYNTRWVPRDRFKRPMGSADR